MTLVCPDISVFQPVITHQFGRRVLIFRVAFGAHYQDPDFLANAAIAKWLYDHKLIDGAVLYQVYLSSATPAEHYAFAWKLIGPTVPNWLMGVMLDVEAWRGTSYPVSGDHSKQINSLGGMHAHRLGSWRAVWIYGNRGDLAEIASKRDPRFPVIVASYGTQLVYKSVKGGIGQQYTDGQAKWGVPKIAGKLLPRSTVGFAGAGGKTVSVACDHNVFDPARFPTGAKLRAFARPATATRPPAKPATPRPPTRPAGHYAALHAGNVLVSPDHNTALFLGDDGQLDLRMNGHHVRYVGAPNA